MRGRALGSAADAAAADAVAVAAGAAAAASWQLAISAKINASRVTNFPMLGR
jgi:hypothetical protein